MAWRRLIPTSAFVLAIRLAGAGAGFLTQFLLARLLAPEALGTFFSATSLAAVLGLITAWGYPNLAPRFVSRYRERGMPRLLAGFLRNAARDTAVSSILAGAAVVLVAQFWPGAEPETRLVFTMAGIAVPVLAALTLNAATAGAIRAFSLAYIPESLVRPILFLGLIGFVAAMGKSLTLITAIAFFFAITAGLAFVQFLILRHILPLGTARRSRQLSGLWRAEALPLVIVALFTSLFADLDILMVTPFLHGAEVAAFGISLKLALLVGFGVQVAHSVAAPDLADAHARRALAGADGALRRASLFPVALTAAATIAAAAGGEHILALFHPEFAQAKWALTILIFCQFLRAVAGPSVQLLTIIGAQRFNAGLCLAALMVLAASNVVLAPSLGMTGAAIAVAFSWSVWLLATGFVLWRKNGLRSDVFYVGRVMLRPRLMPAE